MCRLISVCFIAYRTVLCMLCYDNQQTLIFWRHCIFILINYIGRIKIKSLVKKKYCHVSCSCSAACCTLHDVYYSYSWLPACVCLLSTKLLGFALLSSRRWPLLLNLLQLGVAELFCSGVHGIGLSWWRTHWFTTSRLNILCFWSCMIMINILYNSKLFSRMRSRSILSVKSIKFVPFLIKPN